MSEFNNSDTVSITSNSAIGNGNTVGNRTSVRSNTLFSGDLNQQAISQNVQREIYKQLELLLLKKKAGEAKVTIRQGLLVTIPQVEKVSQLSSTNVSHSLEVLSNVLVQISKQSLHSVCEVLIKMCDPYLDDINLINSTKKIELPSFKDESIESDTEESIPTLNTNSILSPSSPPSTLTSELSSPSLLDTQSVTSPLQNSNESLSSSTSSLQSLTSASGLMSPQQPTSAEDENNDQQQQTTNNNYIGSTNNFTSGLNFISRSKNDFKQISEDTPLYHLLNTIYMVLESHQPNRYSRSFEPGNSSIDQLSKLPPKVITFLFGLLNYNHTPAIRYKAASCLKVISMTSLETITQFYVNKLQGGGGGSSNSGTGIGSNNNNKSISSDDFYREYSTYQKSTKYLEFGFHRDGQIEATSQYFAKLLLELEKVSRAIFIQSIGYTIIHSFPRMFNQQTNYSLVPEPFWTITQKIYDIMLKWSKKSSKLKPVCIRTLFSMIGSSQEFFIGKSSDLLQIWCSAYKESSSKQHRKSYLECLVQYFTTIKSLFIVEAKATFYQTQVELLLPVILPKKTTPSTIESSLILEVLIAMGRFSCSIVVSKYLLSILTISNKSGSSSSGSSSNDFSMESKAIIFKMIYRLNIEFTEQIRYYDRTLWNVLDVQFINYDGESSNPLKYLLLLFPSHCSHENLKEIADKIIKSTFASELDIATMSTIGITKYLSSQPHTTFPSILLQMLTYITNYFGELSGLCKVVKNMCMIMQEFIGLHYLPNKERKMSATVGIDQTTWKNLRDTCEGVSLYLLSSVITPLWSEVFEFINLTGHEIFREIDASLKCSYLADYLPNSNCQIAIPQQEITSKIILTLNCDLTNFLIIHRGDLSNCVNWCWAKLRKRWHPKSQPIGWKNNLAFLLLSLRLNVDQPELTSVEDQLLTEVLTCYFQEREGRTNEELCQLIADLSLYLHPSCYDTVFRFIEQERGRDLKRKKKEVFYTQDHVITYASQLVEKLSLEQYDTIPSIRTALREMTYFWITNSQVIFKDIPLTIRAHTAKLFKNFLALDSRSTLPKSEISLNKASYCKLIFQCLQVLSENNSFAQRDAVLNELEINIHQSLNTLISDACLTDFKKEIIPWLIKSFSMGPHVYSIVSDNLSRFLKRSPKYLNEFIEKSFDNQDSSTNGNASIGSLLFLRSLVSNFSSENYLKWNHNCPPERLALICLFHMVSTDEKARLLSIQLSNDLAMREPNSEELTSLHAHFQTVFSNNLPLHIYLRSSLLYSNSMSNKYQWCTPGLFEECEYFFKSFNSSQRLSMLTLLAPWTRNFWWVLSVGEGLSKKSPYHLLEALFSLTIQAKQQANSLQNQSSIEILWGELISSGDYHSNPNESISIITQYVIDFLMEKYHYSESDLSNRSFQYKLAESRDCSKMIMSFISRRSSTHWSFVIQHMIKYLRIYEPLPSSPIDFSIDTIKSNGIKSKPTNHHRLEEKKKLIAQQLLNNPPPPPPDSINLTSNNAATTTPTPVTTATTPPIPSVVDEKIQFDRLSSIQSEESILAFFEDLSFEFQYQDIITIPTLVPLLLSSILFLYGPNNVNVDSKKILNNILLSLIIQQTSISKEIKSDCQQFIDSDWAVWIKQDKQKLKLVNVLKVGLGDSILEIWEAIALQFSVKPREVQVCLSALDWYGIIRSSLSSKKDGMDGLLGLSCGLWSASLTGEMDIVYKILSLLTSIVGTGIGANVTSANQLTETSYAIIIRLASILLHTSYLLQFNGVLILLYKAMQSLEEYSKRVGNSKLQLRMTEEMIDILCSGLKLEQVVNRGIGHPHTSLLTLWFAKETTLFLDMKKGDSSPSICCALMLAASCMITMSPDDPNTKDFVEYLFEQPVSGPVAKMIPLLYPYYHYSVAKTPGSLPLSKDSYKQLASQLCYTFIDSFPDSLDLISCLISSVNDMVKSLVEVGGGKEEDASFLLYFVNEMLSKYANSHISVSNIQSQVLVEYTQLMIDLSQRSTCAATREEAQHAIPFILSNIPPGLPLGNFDFLKPYDKNGIVNNFAGVFGLHTNQDIINNVYTSLYLINTYLYAVPSTSNSEINPTMKRIIDSNYSVSSSNNNGGSNKLSNSGNKLSNSGGGNGGSGSGNRVLYKQYSSNKQYFDSFTFSFKKKAVVPKPSQLLHSPPVPTLVSPFNDPILNRSSSSSVVQIVSPPSPYKDQPLSTSPKLMSSSNGGSAFKKPSPVFTKNLSEQRLNPPARPSTPPPSLSNLSSPSKTSSSNLFSNNSSGSSTAPPTATTGKTSAPQLPPKRQKPTVSTLNMNQQTN